MTISIMATLAFIVCLISITGTIMSSPVPAPLLNSSQSLSGVNRTAGLSSANFCTDLGSVGGTRGGSFSDTCRRSTSIVSIEFGSDAHCIRYIKTTYMYVTSTS